jgi:DNA replication protein DnaC
MVSFQYAGRRQKKLPEIATLDFIEKGKNIIMTGNHGTGKTMISIALGLKACMKGYKVLFTTVPLLVTTFFRGRVTYV